MDEIGRLICFFLYLGKDCSETDLFIVTRKSYLDVRIPLLRADSNSLDKIREMDKFFGITDEEIIEQYRLEQEEHTKEN